MTKGKQDGDEPSQGTQSSSEPTQEGDQGDQGSEGTSQGSEGTPSPSSPTEGAQTPFEFKHPRLQGKSPEEIEKVFGLLEHTVRDQGQQLSTLHETKPPSGEPDVRPKPQDVSDEEFWKNPTGSIKSMMQEMLTEAIDPFKKDLARGAEADVIATMKSQPGFEDFEDYLPVVRELARKQNVDLTDMNAVRALYFMAVGASQKGMLGSPASNPPDANTPTGAPPVNQGNPPPPAPPQHPASPQPLPNPADKKDIRPLTESERRLAREYGMSEEDYLKWQDGNEMILEPSNLEKNDG